MSNLSHSSIRYLLGFFIASWITAGFSQDVYQVLRDDAQGFAKVARGVPLVFPRDHFPHPQYRIEWWYLTANLKDQKGNDWGVQWTLFRQSLSPDPNPSSAITDWSSNQLWMAHAAITTPQQHLVEQRFARGGIGQTGVAKLNDSGGFEAWIDDWRWHSTSDNLFPSILEFNVGGHNLSLALDSSADWVLNGDAGFSQKSAQGQASYYYSQPSIKLTGTIESNNKTVEVTGNAWLDREWSSQALADNQKGWDWFSLHLDDGSKLMVYQLRHNTNDQSVTESIANSNWISGSWLSADGEMTALGNDDISLNSLSERTITTDNNSSITLPLDWSINLPKLNRSLTIKPLYDEQWLATSFPYWEGVVLVEDDNGQRIGKGYMELTGYQPIQ